MEKQITYIYTDGSSRKNPGPSGWGAILKYKEHSKEISCGYRYSTNNRMELLAVVEALKLIKQDGVFIEIYSDSRYVIDSINKGWVFKWQSNNFKDRLNADLWKKFLEYYPRFKIKMIWVKGHASNEFNNKCDLLATAASSDDNKTNWKIDSTYEILKK